jgi:hypothetical protein
MLFVVRVMCFYLFFLVDYDKSLDEGDASLADIERKPKKKTVAKRKQKPKTSKKKKTKVTVEKNDFL